MQTKQCPMCGEKLDVREVTPCIDCGAFEEQVNLLKQDIVEGFTHDSINFNEYRIFGNVEATFCDVCAVDFGSYDPTYFGLPRGARFGYEKMQL